MPFQRCYHVPTLRKFLERGDPIAPTFRLTKAALWYSAIHTVSEDECVIRFGAPKSELASQYKKYVEVMLAQVDLLCTTDLGVLQALVTYLVGLQLPAGFTRRDPKGSLLTRPDGLSEAGPQQASVDIGRARHPNRSSYGTAL